MTMAFTKRLVEQTVVTAVAAFSAALLASGGALDKAALTGALGAAARAVYGLLVKPVGDVSQPNAVK